MTDANARTNSEDGLETADAVISDVLDAERNDPQPEIGHEGSASTTATPAAARRQGFFTVDTRFVVIVLGVAVVLIVAFALVLALAPTPEGVNALAVVAAPLALIVIAYFGVSLALKIVGDARAATDEALERAAVAEMTAREADAWAAQMESGLRVAVARLRAAGETTTDIERAAGTPDEFF